MADLIRRRSRAFSVAAAATVLGLAIAGPAGAQSPAAGTGPLFVAINKSADQQYFIDLQNSFVAKIEELGGRR